MLTCSIGNQLSKHFNYFLNKLFSEHAPEHIANTLTIVNERMYFKTQFSKLLT